MNSPSWLKLALSEPDQTPSSSRLIMFMWSVTLLIVFIGTALYECFKTGKMPDPSAWGPFLGFAQAGGAVGYLGNQLRRAFGKEKEK
jgi:nitrate/nitrite transporter NarK